MILMVNLFTGKNLLNGESGLFLYLDKVIKFIGVDPQIPGIVPFLILLFLINLIVKFSISVFDAYLTAILRKKMQESVFKHFLYGDWSHMRNFRVGDAVGTNTQEAMIVSKYLTSAVASIYYILTGVTTLALAFWASFKITVVLGIIAIPLMFLMKKMFALTARYSKQSALLRNEFSGDITDRFNGLLQVHVDHNYEFHLKEGLKVQDELTKLDFLTGVFIAVTSSFNLLLPLTALIGFSIWLYFYGVTNLPNLALVASVGVLGLKVASQLNGAVSSIGNLSRLSGSLYPVIEALSVPPIPERILIEQPIAKVVLNHVDYDYKDNKVIHDVSLIAERGRPLVLSGRSGKGKTTLANLIAGLYFPNKGEVHYITKDNANYDSQSYRGHIGFVTQDIYLFKGTLRTNLVSNRDYSDEKIWSVLEQVDATEFVRSMGGLDTESVEAGRALSGGQRRRLGIARVLLSGCDVLIFDEVTAGLDQKNKNAVMDVIEKLSQGYVVVLISHEDLTLPNQVNYSL
jgi:ABC-type multidrug transport system fused ATPase/permease subunit